MATVQMHGLALSSGGVVYSKQGARYDFVDPTPMPEPSPWLLFGTAFMIILWRYRRSPVRPCGFPLEGE